MGLLQPRHAKPLPLLLLVAVSVVAIISTARALPKLSTRASGFYDSSAATLMPVEMPLVTLSNGVEMPMLSYGLWEVSPAEATATIPKALGVGFNHIDESIHYGNQLEVGEQLRQWPRSSFFLTTKIDPDRPVEMTPENAYAQGMEQLEQCRDELQVDVLDLVSLTGSNR